MTPEISLFNSLPAKGKPHTSSAKITVEDFLLGIKYGKWKDQVIPVRNEPDKATRDGLKKKLTSVTVSGLFHIRNQDNLIQHSGFIAIDIDGNTQREALLNDPYVYACFLSVSGKGFVPVFKIDPEKHKESFNWIRSYLYKTYGLVCDPAPQNVASLRYVSFDPDIWINDKAKKARTEVEKKQPKSLPIVLPEDEISRLISEAVARNVNITESYEEYRNIAFAIANGMGENGRSAFHALASISAKYDTRHADKQFDIALADRGTKKITIGTLYHHLKQAGIEIRARQDNTLASAIIAKKQAKPKDAIVRQLTELNNLSETQALQLVDEVYKREDLTLAQVSKDPEKLIENVMEFINQNYELRKNTITGIIENNNRELTKEAQNTMWLRVRSVFNSTSVNFELIDRIIHSEFVKEYHPILNWIEDNRHRHHTGHIDRLISSIKTDTPNADVYIRKWLISLAAAIHGHPVRYVLSLVGGQNSGKTEWFRRLLPSALKKYYAESKLDAGKDDEILMCQKLIVMDDEMGGKSKQDSKRFKELTSKQIFSLRAPYGKHNEDFKRLAVLCGTSNDPQIINDPTGNTRILPVNVISIDHQVYNSVNKDDLFMEIIHLYESGERFELNKDDLNSLSETSEDFEVAPMERELISQFFRAPFPDEYAQELTATEIKDFIEIRTKQRIMAVNKLGIELRKIFGNTRAIKRNGVPLKVYKVVELHKIGNGGMSDSPPI